MPRECVCMCWGMHKSQLLHSASSWDGTGQQLLGGKDVLQPLHHSITYPHFPESNDLFSWLALEGWWHWLSPKLEDWSLHVLCMLKSGTFLPQGEVRDNEKCTRSTTSSELLGSLLGPLCMSSLMFYTELGHPTDLSLSACCIGQGNKEEPPLSKFTFFFFAL